MSAEPKILDERGDELKLTLTGKRLAGGATVNLTAFLGPNVLANLPLPKGPTKPREGEAPPERTLSRKPGGVYTERRSLAELIRRSIKAIQDGEPSPQKGKA